MDNCVEMMRGDERVNAESVRIQRGHGAIPPLSLEGALSAPEGTLKSPRRNGW